MTDTNPQPKLRTTPKVARQPGAPVPSTFKSSPEAKAALARLGAAGGTVEVKDMTPEQLEARRVAFEMARRQEAEIEARAAKKADDDVYFLRCPCSKQLPGLFFCGNKRPDLSKDTMPPSDAWFASYKDPQDKWEAGRLPICQVCLLTEKGAVPMRIRDRYVDKMTADEFSDLGKSDEETAQ